MVYMQVRYNSVGYQRKEHSWARLALIAQPSHPFPPQHLRPCTRKGSSLRGWLRLLNTRKQNKTMAAFCLGTHELGVNAMRFGPNKAERKQRVCKCRDMSVVGDERHVFECTEFATLDTSSQAVFCLVPR